MLIALAGAAAGADEPASQATEQVPTGCDLLAAHPSDPDKITEGLETPEVMEHLDMAIAACRRDAGLFPELPRLTYYLGRTLFYSGNVQDGFDTVMAAADAGHEQAQFVAGLLVLSGMPDGTGDSCGALDLWERSRAQGHFAATVSIAAHMKMDSFASCERPPDADAVRASLKSLAGHRYASEYYNQLLLQVLELPD
jgi:hypothetical protein